MGASKLDLESTPFLPIQSRSQNCQSDAANSSWNSILNQMISRESVGHELEMKYMPIIMRMWSKMQHILLLVECFFTFFTFEGKSFQYLSEDIESIYNLKSDLSNVVNSSGITVLFMIPISFIPQHLGDHFT